MLSVRARSFVLFSVCTCKDRSHVTPTPFSFLAVDASVTPAVVASATNRATKLRAICEFSDVFRRVELTTPSDADLEFPGLGNAAVLGLLRGIQEAIARLEATQFNMRVVGRNARQEGTGIPFRLRRKEVLPALPSCSWRLIFHRFLGLEQHLSDRYGTLPIRPCLPYHQ